MEKENESKLCTACGLNHEEYEDEFMTFFIKSCHAYDLWIKLHHDPWLKQYIKDGGDVREFYEWYGDEIEDQDEFDEYYGNEYNRWIENNNDPAAFHQWFIDTLTEIFEGYEKTDVFEPWVEEKAQEFLDTERIAI